MDPDEFDVYPISHNGKVYNLITAFDLSFQEVRAMLDWLDERGAFRATPGDDFMGPGKLFTLTVLGVTFEVDVQGYEVIVYRRSP
ncbi:MAG: hypothetical protein HZA60_06860 [Deltaproteobacteria bacterium]|nr:hypothetical protein [Deltaproteobacteria bacterium]